MRAPSTARRVSGSRGVARLDQRHPPVCAARACRRRRAPGRSPPTNSGLPCVRSWIRRASSASSAARATLVASWAVSGIAQTGEVDALDAAQCRPRPARAPERIAGQDHERHCAAAVATMTSTMPDARRVDPVQVVDDDDARPGRLEEPGRCRRVGDLARIAVVIGRVVRACCGPRPPSRRTRRRARSPRSPRRSRSDRRPGPCPAGTAASGRTSPSPRRARRRPPARSWRAKRYGSPRPYDTLSVQVQAKPSGPRLALESRRSAATSRSRHRPLTRTTRTGPRPPAPAGAPLRIRASLAGPADERRPVAGAADARARRGRVRRSTHGGAPTDGLAAQDDRPAILHRQAVARRHGPWPRRGGSRPGGRATGSAPRS